jgi:hypothetical protein
MANLPIQYSVISANDVPESELAGVMIFIAATWTGQPSYEFVYDYGTSTNTSASPYPVFDATSGFAAADTAALAFIEATACGSILTTVNNEIGEPGLQFSGYACSNVVPPVLQDLSQYVPITTTINGQPLSSNITLTPSEIGSPSGSGTSTGTNTGDQNLSAYALAASLSAVATTGNYTDLSGKPTSLTPLWNGTTEVQAIEYTNSGTTNSSGQVVFELTTNGASNGTAIFPTGPIDSTTSVKINSVANAYAEEWAWSNSNKTLTVTVYQLSTVVLGIMGSRRFNDHDY